MTGGAAAENRDSEPLDSTPARDIARYLPLSHRPPVDESSVADGWRTTTASCLDLVADLLDSLPAAAWQTPSLCPGWTVRDVAAHLAWRMTTSTSVRFREVARVMITRRTTPARAVAAIARDDASPPVELVARLHHAAADRRAVGSARGSQGVGELTEAVVHGLDIANPLELPLTLPRIAVDAVALARAVSSTAVARAVLRHYTLVTVDADWTLGTGTPLRATAADHVLLLFGRMPRPAAAGGLAPDAGRLTPDA